MQFTTSGSNWTQLDHKHRLELEGTLAAEWKNYRKALTSSGVQFSQRPDELKWLGGYSSRKITVKNAYEAIENKKHAFLIDGWRKSL